MPTDNQMREEIVKMMNKENPVVTVKDIAQTAHVGENTVRNWIGAPNARNMFIMKSAIREIRENEQTAR